MSYEKRKGGKMARQDKPWKRQMNNGNTWEKKEQKKKEQKTLEDFEEEDEM